MKKNKYANKLIMKPAISSLLVLAMLAVSTYAYISNTTHGWYASNDKVGAEGAKIVVKTDHNIEIYDITIYKYDLATKNYIAQSATTLETNYQSNIAALPWSLNPYDSIFNRNSNNAILVRVGLADSLGDPYTFTIGCDENSYTDDNTNTGKLLRKFSNVVSIKCAMSSTLDALTTAKDASPSAIYAAGQSFFTTSAAVTGSLTNTSTVINEDRFVSYTGETTKVLSGKKTSMTFASVNNSTHAENTDDKVNYTLSGDKAYLYLYIDYDPELVKIYLKGIGGVDSDFLVDNITFNQSTSSAIQTSGTADFKEDIAFLKLERAEIPTN